MWYKTFKLIKTHLNSHVLHLLIVHPLMACMEGYLITQTTFLHFSLSNESSRCLQKWTKNRAGCNYLAFLRCGFSKVSSRRFDQSKNSHTIREGFKNNHVNWKALTVSSAFFVLNNDCRNLVFLDMGIRSFRR